MAPYMQMPDVAEITEFFAAEPIEQSIDDGYWCYEVVDQRGVTLRFSFNCYERSVQTTLSSLGQRLAEVSHELADSLVIRQGLLRCEFSTRNSKTSLTVDLREGISVVWATIRTE
jgi:hypothetical protein